MGQSTRAFTHIYGELLMNKNQENKLTMYEAVNTLLSDNGTIVSSVAAMQTAATALADVIQRIKDKGREKSTATAGKTQTKHDAEDALVAATLEVASALFSYARKIKNNELKEIADITETKLRRLRDTELGARATTIYKRANAEVANLADYSITTQKIADLQTRITEYVAAMGKRESSIAERSGATQALAGLFDETDELLYDDLDRLMETVRNTETEFYNKYFAARVIKDIGLGRGEATPTQPTPQPTPPSP
jgi:hypothetical protein